MTIDTLLKFRIILLKIDYQVNVKQHKNANSDNQ